jgi:hypothetical protein
MPLIEGITKGLECRDKKGKYNLKFLEDIMKEVVDINQSRIKSDPNLSGEDLDITAVQSVDFDYCLDA